MPDPAPLGQGLGIEDVHPTKRPRLGQLHGPPGQDVHGVHRGARADLLQELRREAALAVGQQVQDLLPLGPPRGRQLGQQLPSHARVVTAVLGAKLQHVGDVATLGGADRHARVHARVEEAQTNGLAERRKALAQGQCQPAREDLPHAAHGRATVHQDLMHVALALELLLVRVIK